MENSNNCERLQSAVVVNDGTQAGAEQLHVVLMLHYSVSHYIASALMSKRIALSVKDKVAVISALNDAEQFATVLGYTDFTCTTGWLDRFKASGRLCDEARSSNTKSVDAWLNSVWPALRQQYKDENIFNRDETAVFYRLGPK
ncbi:Tigger transposable element-derived protein 4 [Trichinella zimbabwensis]|uniref:Tigger transposable element-derived protein 4 n=1 Tax=Trichinella zimbabwensis TaxID=268475 RepID=A0A0V1GW67_9BILA|nr:Tigger transposable element-derived protein 4 [Trichinella zimbabwensis]